MFQSPGDLEKQVKSARPGKVFCYHTGFLMFDREYDKIVRSIGQRALRLCKDGLGYLVQRKLREGHYEYLLIRR